MYGMSPELQDAADQRRYGYQTALEIMAEQHAEINSMDSIWLDEALSDYVFQSANEERETEYRLALYAAMHHNTVTPLQNLMAKAIHEKAEKEVKAFVEDTPDAA